MTPSAYQQRIFEAQEMNLKYVAITRARKELVFVTPLAQPMASAEPTQESMLL